MSTNEELPEVTLDEFEVGWAKSVGYYRHFVSVRKKRKQSDGSDDSNALKNHQQGAAAELALAKYLSIDWTAPVNTFNGFPDLDGLLESRSKQPRQSYMRLYPNRDSEKGDSVFASISSLGRDLTKFRIDGWIVGKDAMKAEYIEKSKYNEDSEWHPPVAHLQPPATLKPEVTRRQRVFRRGRTKMLVWVKNTLADEAAKAAQKGL